MSSITAKAWNNGQHHPTGAGYGLKISPRDRDRYFIRSWRTVRLIGIGDEPINVNIDKKSFWDPTCRELISAHLGRWMIAQGIAPWPEGKPPIIMLMARQPGVFEVDGYRLP
jgi:hypothetical protein